MGFSSISINGSDKASDLAYATNCALAKVLKKGLSEDSDTGFNTPGPINVALYFESYIKSVSGSYDLCEVLDTTICILEGWLKADFGKHQNRLEELVSELKRIPR